MSDPPPFDRFETPYPMVRTPHRQLAPDHKGPIFVWDIDKTYLDTRFSQLKNLIKIPFEFGVDKRAYPGVPELLRGLRAGLGRAYNPLFFISASPPELRRMIERKMLIDGVEFDGITFKNPLRLVLKREFDQLKQQIPFKLSALLMLDRELPDGAEIYLFGDDAEKDALIYSIYGDIAAGRLRGSALSGTLLDLGVRLEYAEAVATYSKSLPHRDRLRGIFIHLVVSPDGASVRDYTPIVVGYPNAAVAADVLHKRGLVETQLVTQLRSKVGAGTAQEGRVRSSSGFHTPDGKHR